MKKQQITTCQPDKAVRHGGDIYRNPVRYDFSINLNPLGMPEGVKRRLKETVEDWGRYPDSQCEALTRALADYHQIAADRILCSNGAADLIYGLVQTIKPRQALLLSPGFAEYEQALARSGCEIRYSRLYPGTGFLPDVQQLCEQITPDTEVLFLALGNGFAYYVTPDAICQEPLS